MNLESRIDELIGYYCDHYSTQDESWLISQFNDISDDVRKLECEVDKLRAENARLTEIAAEKATRIDELYEALNAIMWEAEDLKDDINYCTYNYALSALNKNNPDGEL